MLRILRFLFVGDWHQHHWEPYGKVVKVFSSEHEKMYVRKEQSFKCTICGKPKIFEV